MIDHFNAMALAVHDVRKCAEFYRDRLGLKTMEVEDDFAYLTFTGKAGPGLALVSMDGFAKEIPKQLARPQKDVLQRSYFAVFVDDTDRMYEELKRKGVHFVTPPTTRPSGQRYAYLEDPEGNLWEISHFPKK